MKRVSLCAMLIGAVFLIFPHPAGAQAVGDLFRVIQLARPVAMMRSSRASCSFVPSARN